MARASTAVVLPSYKRSSASRASASYSKSLTSSSAITENSLPVFAEGSLPGRGDPEEASWQLDLDLRRLDSHKMEDKIQFVDRNPAPPLLPILRSRQQAELLAWLLDDPEREASLGELSLRLDIPTSSVHREVGRAERAGLVVSRRVGRTRLVRVNKQSRLVAPLRELLLMTFGVPGRLRQVLGPIPGVESAYIFGSWAARYLDVIGSRPVGDIDVLVLGTPDRDEVYRAATGVDPEFGYPVQITIRSADWLEAGAGSFHDTVASRPLLQIVGAEG